MMLVHPILALPVACDINRSEPPSGLEPLEGTGAYEFAGYEPLSSKPLLVHFHVPAGAGDDAPVVFVLHGTNRDAEDYRDHWLDLADEYDYIVAAPEFRDVFYAGSNAYQLGNVFVDGESPRPETLRDEEDWTFQWIEPLFDDLVARTPTEVERYQLWGHSGGAQFLHRFVLFVPDARYDVAVAANAGWYTVPDDEIDYPYGLGRTPLEGGDRSYFGRSLVIHNGDRDTSSTSAGLRHTEEADAQGENRFERGAYFVEESARLAGPDGFAWRRVVVPGIGHSDEGMAPAGALEIAEALGRR